jgi:hypothetical protein
MDIFARRRLLPYYWGRFPQTLMVDLAANTLVDRQSKECLSSNQHPHRQPPPKSLASSVTSLLMHWSPQSPVSSVTVLLSHRPPQSPASSVTGLSTHRFRYGGRVGGGSGQLCTAAVGVLGGGQKLLEASEEALWGCGAPYRHQGTAIGLPLLPIGQQKARGGQKGISPDGEGWDCPAVQQPMVLSPTHGPETGRQLVAVRRLQAAELGDCTELISAT